MKRQSRSTRITPPMRAQTDGKYVVVTDGFTTVADVILEVASRYRNHRAISTEIQSELLRYHALKGLPFQAGLSGFRGPILYFQRFVVDQWLDSEGGRAWIIAECEARRADCSSRVVIAFPVLKA